MMDENYNLSSVTPQYIKCTLKNLSVPISSQGIKPSFEIHVIPKGKIREVVKKRTGVMTVLKGCFTVHVLPVIEAGSANLMSYIIVIFADKPASVEC